MVLHLNLSMAPYSKYFYFYFSTEKNWATQSYSKVRLHGQLYLASTHRISIIVNWGKDNNFKNQNQNKILLRYQMNCNFLQFFFLYLIFFFQVSLFYCLGGIEGSWIGRSPPFLRDYLKMNNSKGESVDVMFVQKDFPKVILCTLWYIRIKL